VLALGGCTEADARPVGPDLQALVDAYAQPSAELDLEGARTALLDSLPQLRALRAIDSLRFLLDAVQSTGDGFALRGLAQQLHADLDGYVHVRTICPGPDANAETPNAQRDGTVELTARITDAAVEPVVFGVAHGCRFSAPTAGILPDWLPLPDEDFQARLDGPIAVHLGTTLVLGRSTALQPLMRVAGTLEVAGLPELQDFDFRVPGPGVLELRVALGARDNVVLVLEQDRLRVREARGTWRCTVAEELECSAEF
jgi:hypothetical protein